MSSRAGLALLFLGVAACASRDDRFAPETDADTSETDAPALPSDAAPTYPNTCVPDPGGACVCAGVCNGVVKEMRCQGGTCQCISGGMTRGSFPISGEGCQSGPADWLLAHECGLLIGVYCTQP